MDDLDYVRASLKAAQKKKELSEVMYDTRITRQTLYNVMNKEKGVSLGTLETLFKYFKGREKK